MTKLIAVLALAAATVAFSPRPMAAQDADCTRNYTSCLNDSYDMEGILQTMADIECFSEYLGCIAKDAVTE